MNLLEPNNATSGAEPELLARMLVGDSSPMIEDCIIRLVRLADRPHGLGVLRQSIMREIYYWLLTGPNGARAARQLVVSAAAQRIAAVVQLIRENFDRPIGTEKLVSLAKMSPASFFQHFKSVTSMSPLQYQKQLRLLEARHLIVMATLSVAEAANKVGYESASQFNQEYTRMFGMPPDRDTYLFYSRASERATIAS